MDTKKLKQVGFTAGIALAAILILNTIAKRVQPVAKLRDTVNNGL